MSPWNRFNEPAPYFEEIFNNIKSDVLRYESDLHQLREEDRDRFDYLFESIDYLVSRIGVGKDIHYFRNELNKFSGAPDTLDQMLELAQKGEWILLSPYKSQAHMFGQNGEYSLKFVSSDGRFEAVYDISNELVTDPINMGTYNYKNPNSSPIGHLIFDYLPWKE